MAYTLAYVWQSTRRSRTAETLSELLETYAALRDAGVSDLVIRDEEGIAMAVEHLLRRAGLPTEHPKAAE